MNRFKRDGTTSKARDEEGFFERQALIDDDDCTGDAYLPQGSLNRRNRYENGYELRSLQRMKDATAELNADYTYYDIQPGDSLQSICLRYTCPINHVKRLNGLMTDQDFHGLIRLKLPLGKLGLLEEVIKQQNSSSEQDLIQIHNNNDYDNKAVSHRFTNSPGSALSIRGPRFRPLLSPEHNGDNSDREANIHETNNLHVSYSFPSLRELSHSTDNRTIDETEISGQPRYSGSRTDTSKLRQKNLIKSDLETGAELAKVTIDTLLTDAEPKKPNIFEDLDFHVERAKVAAETYNQRAEELANRIDIDGGGLERPQTTRASKIPELFFSGENFGLNLTKLVALIFFICLVVPFVYMNQVNVIKKQL